MAKSNFLLVDLNEKKTKKLAETITSDTSRKILNHLAEKSHDTEANIAKDINKPISTVHYHLLKLVEARLVIVEEFHYSQKGREVNHYKLANKYIIIAPKKVSGLKQKLKGILPVGIIALGISVVIKFITSFQNKTAFTAARAPVMLAEQAVDKAESTMMADAVPRVVEGTAKVVTSSQPDIALWFFLGSVVTIAVYVLYQMIKERLKK